MFEINSLEFLNSWIGNPESLDGIDRGVQWEKHVEEDTFQQFLSCIRACA